jgi:hypothetical protein
VRIEDGTSLGVGRGSGSMLEKGRPSNGDRFRSRYIASGTSRVDPK